MTIRARAWLVVLVAASAASAARAETAPAAPAAATVYTIKLEHFMFGPATARVAVGTVVRWQNLDGEPHTVVSVDGLFRSGALDQGEGFAFRFERPGTYRYVCSIHPQMVGTVVVTASR
jgi:plastocyanin